MVRAVPPSRARSSNFHSASVRSTPDLGCLRWCEVTALARAAFKTAFASLWGRGETRQQLLFAFRRGGHASIAVEEIKLAPGMILS